VNHSDFLAHALPINIPQFDRIVVVTAPEDEKTRRVCQMWSVECILTDAFRTRWDEFCKGVGINEGLAKLDKDSWIVHMDADIVLPSHFRTQLSIADLATDMIYGCDRVDFKSYAAWQKYLGDPKPQRQAFFVHTTATFEHAPRMATRVVLNHQGGYLPIGYFQMWHADSKQLQYEQGHADAGREDSQFAARWPRSRRALFPEVIVFHLESEAAPMAVNWRKRGTKPFQYGNEDYEIT
jgi:hypothetical protein